MVESNSASSDVYRQLEDHPEHTVAKAILLAHFRDQLSQIEVAPDEPARQAIAYRLAGLMSLEAVRKLPEDDPYREVLEMAGELELPDAHRSRNATWKHLAQLVVNLR